MVMMPLAARKRITGASYAWGRRNRRARRSGAGLEADCSCGMVEPSQQMQEPEARLVEGQQAQCRVSPRADTTARVLRVRTKRVCRGGLKRVAM